MKMASSTKELLDSDNTIQISSSSHINKGTGNLYVLNSNTTSSESIKEGFRKRVNEDKNSGKKRKSFVKRFRKEWMDEPIFRGWLYPIPNNNERCWCSVCNVVLLCGHSELEKHASGKKHSDLMLIQSLKGELMDTSQDNVLIQETYSTTASQDDSRDFQEETLEIADGDNLDSHLVFQVTQEGTLVEMKMEDYDKLTSSNNKPNETNKISLINKGTSITRGNTTITRTNNSTLKSTKTPASKVRVISQSALQTKFNSKNDTFPDGLSSDTDDFDDDDDDELPDSQQMIKEMKSEVLYQEKLMASEKRIKSERLDHVIDVSLNDNDELMKLVAERELEVRLQHLEERRRQRFNIYKLKLQEMDARVKHAEAELNRSEELHKLKVRQLELQIQQCESSIQ